MTRREESDAGLRLLAMVPPVKRNGGPQTTCMDNIRNDMRELGIKETDIQNRKTSHAVASLV